jgi:hypothetical protein
LRLAGGAGGGPFSGDAAFGSETGLDAATAGALVDANGLALRSDREQLTRAGSKMPRSGRTADPYLATRPVSRVEIYRS